MKSVIFLAPPAAGKGTFSDFLEKKFGYQHISTGDLLREKALKNESVEKRLKSGALFSDDEVLELFKQKVNSYPKETLFVFDGIPRTLYQAEKMDEILDLDYIVIYLDVSKDILLERVLGRVICPKCHRSYHETFDEFKPKVEGICDDCGITLEKRVDDTREAFLKRYNEYLLKTKPVLDYYRKKNQLVEFSNTGVHQEKITHLMEVIK